MSIHQVDRNLIDLISEKSALLSQHTEENWHDYGEISISPAEWNFLAFVKEEKETVSDIARRAGISRQAAHKFFRNLEAKHLVKIDQSSPRERLLLLSPLGIKCYEQYTSLQQRLEENITSAVGEENVALLKQILTTKWLGNDEKEAQ